MEFFLPHHMERMLATELVAASKGQLHMLVFNILFQTKSSPKSNYLILQKPMLMVFFVSSKEVLSNNEFLELWFATSSLFKGHRVTINSVSLLQAFVLQWRRHHLWNTWKKLAWLRVAAAKCRWQLKILTLENSTRRIELSD